MTTDVTFDRPREKLQSKGAPSLSSAELLQVIIGSGNGQASVVRIAKRSLKVLSKYGSHITFEQLMAVAGLGPAHVCQILAAFELASRYPMSSRQVVINSNDKTLGLITELRSSKTSRVIYLTVDGARRLIAKRVLIVSTVHPSSLLRKVFADAVADNAAGIMIAVGATDYSLEPSMFDLSLARDVRAMSQLFMVTIHAHLLVNQEGERSLRGESW